ncbi:MAG: hypothetical protein MUF42_04515 [Cytophagaceae bacterium]|jgi:hypothetical protein|nr:hypothetical protein [Cytophagaceae bacterium]
MKPVKSLYFLLFAPLILFFLSGCKKSDIEPIETKTIQEERINYYPLNVGNCWVYETHIVEDEKVKNLLSRDSIVVDRAFWQDGKLVYVVKQFKFQPFLSEELSFFYHKKDEEVWDNFNKQIFRYPSPQYTKTVHIEDPSMSRTYHYSDVWQTGTIEVGAFQFQQCVDIDHAVIDISGEQFPMGITKQIHHFYAPKIGLVKSYCPFAREHSLGELKTLVYYSIKE